MRYVRELRRTGVDVRTESFLFSSYDLDRATLRVGDVGVQPARIVFDPYGGATDIGGNVALVAALTVNGENGVAGLDLSQRVVVTTKAAQYYRIAARQPAAIVFVADNDFEKLKGTGAGRAALLLRAGSRQ